MWILILSIALLDFVSCNAPVKIDLSGNWQVTNENKTSVRKAALIGPINAAVPGGIYSDLEDAGIIDDIRFGMNDVEYRWIAREDWTYSRKFQVDSQYLNATNIQLVLPGVDTIAKVFINDKKVLKCHNMFVRYTADIKSAIGEGSNTITVKFKSPINEAKRLFDKRSYVIPPKCTPKSYNGECHINMLRKMGASFSWDWGPAFPSVGLWKAPEIVIGPQIKSLGFSTTLAGARWLVNVEAEFDPSTSENHLSPVTFNLLDGDKKIFTEIKMIQLGSHHLRDRIYSFFTIPSIKIQRWWPNGYGSQKLYTLTASSKHSEKSVQVGFRTVEVIQEDVAKDPSSGKTFYFLVNGIKMFAKGTNWIPSDILPEKMSDEKRVGTLLEAAALSNFNMIRVWGGGVYESDFFYETCDRLGIMVWQDLMFACSMYPANRKFLENVKVEVEQNIQRLKHHSSIVIWAGNNENEGALVDNWYGTASNFALYKKDYVKLYAETLKPLVEKLDPVRQYVTSSPSNGVKTEEEGYVSKKPGNPLYGDVHYYNYINDGWDYQTYPKPRFASEYGLQSWPSAHCLRSEIPLGNMSYDSPFIDHRQHYPAGNSLMKIHIDQNLPSSDNIYDIIYLSQIDQAMTMKIQSELYRSLKSILLDSGEGYTMGALYWQLNDVWQAPSWSSIDYCGTWKMLQYYSQEFFAPVIVSPQLSGDGTHFSVYTVVDGNVKEKNVNVTLNIYQWSNKNWAPVKKISRPSILDDNRSSMSLRVEVDEIHKYCRIKEDCFLSATLEQNGKKVLAPENFFFFSPLKNAHYPSTSVKISKIDIREKGYAIDLIVKASAYSLFVWLDTNGLEGHFSENGFHMVEQTKAVRFFSKVELTLETFRDTVTLRWLQQSYKN